MEQARHRGVAFVLALATSASVLTALVAAVGADQVIARTEHGQLIVGGNTLSPPYVFTLSKSALLANGVLIRPIPSRDPRKYLHAPHSESAARRFLLGQAVRKLAEDLRDRGVPPDSVHAFMRRAYQQSGLTDSVWSGSGGFFCVLWRGRPGEELISYPPDVPPPPQPHPSLAKVYGDEGRDMAAFLDREGLVLVGDGYLYYVPAIQRKDCEREIMRLRSIVGRPSIHSPRAGVSAESSDLPGGFIRDLSLPQPLDSLRESP